MLQSVESQLSTADAQFIEAHKLGTPLGVYRLKSGYLRFVRRGGVCLFFLAAIMLILEIFILMRYQQIDASSFFLFLLPFVFSLLGGWLLLWIEAPRARREHIIVCEQGLLQIGRAIRSKNVEIVRWTNIQNVYKGVFGLDYSIVCREGKTLSISLYQDIEGLFKLIRKQTEIT